MTANSRLAFFVRITSDGTLLDPLFHHSGCREREASRVATRLRHLPALWHRLPPLLSATARVLC
jgi:hypothetical protein